MVASMNNEPVAWLRYENKHWRLDFPMVRFYTNVVTPEIPLYTTPQIKELSDEEILKEWHWKYTDCFEDFLLQFAKAILKKASEK